MNADDLYKQKNNFFIEMSPTLRGGVGLAVVLGALTAAGGFASGEWTRTWGSFLFNLMFFFSLALGGVAFGGMQDVIGAKWGRPIKRVHESFGSFLPVASICFVLFIVCIKLKVLGADQVYIWIADRSVLDHFHGKDVWLQPNFMFVRDIISVVGIFLLAKWHLKKTTAADMALLAGDERGAKQLAEESQAKLRYWSAPILFAHSIFFSVLCFDLTMSLAPTWFSTLWGGWSFALMMHLLMATLLIVMFSLKNTPIGQYIQRQQFHDIGKLMHGFTAFFAYLTYAHVLTYWYINMPEETSYFHARLEQPWIYFIMAAPLLCFIIPMFTLIPKVSKWTAPITIPVATLIIVAQWLNYMMVVIPEVADAASWKFPWIELGMFLGFFGAFVISVFRFGKKTPMLAVADPLLKESLESHH